MQSLVLLSALYRSHQNFALSHETTTLSVVDIHSVGCTDYSIGCVHYSVGYVHYFVGCTHCSVGCTLLCRLTYYSVGCNINSVICTHYSVGRTDYSIGYVHYFVGCTHCSVGCTLLCRLTYYCVGCNIYSVICTHYSVDCKYFLCRLYALLSWLCILLSVNFQARGNLLAELAIVYRSVII